MFFLKFKDETPKYFKTFVNSIQSKFGSNILKIRTDNGSEFKNMKVKELVEEEGMSMSFLLHTPLNKMEWRKGRTTHLLRWQEPC
jgi:hypothetical protein